MFSCCRFPPYQQSNAGPPPVAIVASLAFRFIERVGHRRLGLDRGLVSVVKAPEHLGLHSEQLCRSSLKNSPTPLIHQLNGRRCVPPPASQGHDALLRDSGEHAANLQDRRPYQPYPPGGLLLPHAGLALDR